MAADAKTVVHRWFDEVWNRGVDATIDELFAPEAIAHGLGVQSVTVRGPAEFRVFWRNLRSALPDIQIRIEDTMADGDKAAVRVVIEATHTGDGLGVSPTGKRIHVPGIVIVRVQGGQIVEGWNSWDQLGLLQQVGAIPPGDASDPFLDCN
ncbi:MAG: ester cyclase [Bryobacteraceae bacterium]